MHRITNIKVLENYNIEIAFADGTRGTVDLSHLVGRGVFAIWRDYEALRDIKIGSAGELVWGDQVDLCPDSLYLRITNQEPEDIFPHLRREATHA